MLNTLQLIVHLPLFSVVHPSNALTFYLLLFEVANFSLLDTSDVQAKVLKIGEEDPHTFNFEILGYEQLNSIVNLGSMFLYLSLSAVMILLY